MNTGLLWVSHAKDLEWFKVSAKSYARNARGFDAAKVVVPNPDVEAFKRAAEPNGIMVCGFDQHPTKGMLHHELMECYGDEHFPRADVIFHVDSDCIFAFPFKPLDYLPDGKVLIRFWDWDDRPTNDAQQWKAVAEKTLGFTVPRATMCGWPLAHVREVYRKTREAVEQNNRCSFEEYVFRQRNEFPQTFCEYETLGAIAHKFFQDRYSWRDIMRQGHPPVQVVSSWSHGGFDRPHQFGHEVGGYQTPRQMFTRLGLL